MRKITLQDINDDYFFNNGYWKKCVEVGASFIYTTIVDSEKWKKLFDTCYLKLNGKSIITPEMIVEAINEGNTKRQKIKRNHYQKIKRPEGYLTVKERREKRRKDREIREKRHDNRQSK